MMNARDPRPRRRHPRSRRPRHPTHAYLASLTSERSRQTVYKILRKRLAQAGVEDLRPHDFRRTFV